MSPSDEANRGFEIKLDKGKAAFVVHEIERTKSFRRVA